MSSNNITVAELHHLADRLDSQAHISTRPGQLEELGWIAARLRVWANNLTNDAEHIVLSRADAAWLCGVIHGEPDVGPDDHTRYDRAHRLLEGDRDA